VLKSFERSENVVRSPSSATTSSNAVGTLQNASQKSSNAAECPPRWVAALQKELTYKTYPHNPPHLFLSDCKYFITAATFNKVRWFQQPEAKLHLLSSIQKGFGDFNWTLEDWVILDNHYHLMLQSPENPLDLPEIIREIHRFTAIWVKKNVAAAKQTGQIWHNYWDKCLTFEKAYFARVNYIWYNPVKHGYVEDAAKWEFGSYAERISADEDYCKRFQATYPCDRVKEKDDF